MNPTAGSEWFNGIVSPRFLCPFIFNGVGRSGVLCKFMTFSHLFFLKKVTFCVKEYLDLTIWELLPFGGFLAYLDLASMNQYPRAACNCSRNNSIPTDYSSSI
jgi:hypothetical protein